MRDATPKGMGGTDHRKLRHRRVSTDRSLGCSGFGEIRLASCAQFQLANPVESLLAKPSIGCNQVRRQPNHNDLKAHDRQNGRQNQRLDVTAGRFQKEKIEIAQAQQEPQKATGAAQEEEDPERIVHGVDAQDGHHRLLEIVPGGSGQSRFPELLD